MSYHIFYQLSNPPHRGVGPQYGSEVEHVKHFIWTLRQKIETDPGDPKHLITERGFGYRFE